MKKIKQLLLLLLCCGGVSEAIAQTAAKPADALIESIGMNIHGNYGQYSDRTDIVVNTLKNIGLRHVRDAGGGQFFPGYDLWAWQKDVADRAGVKFNLIFGLGNSQETVAGQCDYLGTRVWGIEGHNEVHPDQLTELVDFQKMMWNVSQTRSHVNVLTWTYSVAVNFDPTHPNVEAWTDYGAIHPYHKFGRNSQYNAGPMSCGYWDDMWGFGYIPGIRAEMVPTKQLISTENGFSTGYQDDDKTGMSELASAKYNVRACLENFRLNFKKTYLYELINIDDNNGYTESWYGVAKTTGALKPAGTALKNLIAVLQEKGQDNISTTPLNYSLSCPNLSVVPDQDGYSNEVHNVLLQKSNGDYYLVLWQEANSYDWNNRTDINVPSVNVTVNFGKTFANVARYVPLNSADVQQTWTNLSSVTVPVADHPVILKLSGSSTPPVSSNIALNKSTTTSGSCNTNEGGEKAVDGNIYSKWCHNVAGAKWLRVDLGQTYNITRWVVKHAGVGGESATLNTRDFKLQVSSDGTTFSDVDAVTGNTANTTDRNVTTTGRYIRLYITNSGADNAARIYEFEAYGTVAAASNSNVALNKTTTVSGTCNSNEGGGKAVDGNIYSKWCHNVAGAKWLRVDLGQTHSVSRWIVRHAGVGGESATLNTRDFKLQVSNDGTNFSDVDAVTGNTANTTDRNISTSGRYFRLYITNSGADNAARIYEFELYGTASARIGNTAEVTTGNFELSPNPASTAVTLTLRAHQAQTVVISLVNVQGVQAGQFQRAIRAGKQQITLPLSHTQKGLYLLQVNLDGQRHVKKLVVE